MDIFNLHPFISPPLRGIQQEHKANNSCCTEGYLTNVDFQLAIQYLHFIGLLMTLMTKMIQPHTLRGQLV